MKYEKQISKAIKKISKESGLTYGQIAIKLGISKSGVNNWVWRNQMPIDSMLKVCEVFGMEIMDFFKPEEWDEVVFDMNEFFLIVDDGKITVMRKGRGKVTVERPAIRMETTICSYGERRE